MGAARRWMCSLGRWEEESSSATHFGTCLAHNLVKMPGKNAGSVAAAGATSLENKVTGESAAAGIDRVQ